MPLNLDLGTSGSHIYCSLCFTEGEFIYKGNDINEFKSLCYKGMRERGINKWLAKFYTFLISFAPRWRKSKLHKNEQ